MVKADYERHLLSLSQLDAMVLDNGLKRLEGDFPTHQGALIPIKAVADWLGVTVKALTSDEDFPLKKISGRYYVSRIGLARWIS